MTLIRRYISKVYEVYVLFNSDRYANPMQIDRIENKISYTGIDSISKDVYDKPLTEAK